MTIASAAPAAAPSMPAAPARSAAGSGASFAQELSGATTTEDAQASGSQSASARPAATVVKAAATVTKPAAPVKQPNKKSGPPAQTTALAAPVALPTTEPVATPAQNASPAETASALEIAVPLAPPAPEIAAEAPDPKTSASGTAHPGDTPAVTNGSGIAPRAQDFAFAVRVQPVQNTSHTSLNREMASASAVAAASKKPATEETPAQHFDATPLAQPATHSTVEPVMAQAAARVTTAAAPETVPHTETAVPASESVTRPAAPIKDLSLQVTQPGKERVDVHVVQQDNEVRVSVHSGDAVLASGLRHGLSELQGRLEENGYRSEIWRPGAAAAPVASATGPQSTNNQSRSGDAPAGQQQGGSQQESGRRQQNQPNQPRWQEELESSLTGGQSFTGGTLGFRS